MCPVKCTWLQGFTSHLKVHTCTRQGTVVAGLMAARQLSSGTTLSAPLMNWTQDTVLWATPRSQDTEQGDVLTTFHLDQWQHFGLLFLIPLPIAEISPSCAAEWFTLPGSCERCRKPQLQVWKSCCTLNPPTPPPPPPFLEHSTAPCWPPLLHTLHCILLAWSATCVEKKKIFPLLNKHTAQKYVKANEFSS